MSQSLRPRVWASCIACLAFVALSVGVALAQGLWATVHEVFPQYLPLGRIAWIVMAYGVIVATGIGLVSGLVPAIRASRLSVIDGLRRLG